MVIDRWHDRVAALVMAWYPGMSGGDGIADVLTGLVPSSGRLPCTWPSMTTRLPEFRRFTRRIRYGPLHGYRLMEATGQAPAFAFGYGLGYATIELATPLLAELADDGDRVATVAVEVSNRSDRAGVEVVQVYEPLSLGTDRRRLRTLRGFRRWSKP